MASRLDKDDYIYDIDHLTELMASMDTEVPESGAPLPKSQRRKLPKNQCENQRLDSQKHFFHPRPPQNLS